MKVSLNLAQQVSNVDLKAISRDELVRKIGAQLGAVEETIDFGARFEGALVAQVVSCDDHPHADRLHVCRIDDGGVADGLDRGEDGLVQVVCGAPNVRAGLLVAWLPPGAVVPSSRNEAEPFVLDARALRGVISQGMLASPQELGLGDDHSGILEISEPVEPGTQLKNLYDLDDFIVDCENKMFTHRPDCFGVLGVARELAGIQGLTFKSPEWYLASPQFDHRDSLALDVSNDTSHVSRFMAVALESVTVEQSPLWLRSALVRSGLKPINNVVDITNYVMHLTGQPLHAYDYDKVTERSDGEATLAARQAHSGESLTVLGGKTIQLDEADIVIATDRQPVGLGGVMGGADTEVDGSTTRIILEAATFDMYDIRRTSMRHGLFTEAVTRFNKGQSPLQNDRVLAHAMRLLAELAGARQASNVFDEHDHLSDLPDVRVNAGFINERLGSALSSDEIRQLLLNVEIPVSGDGDELVISVPFWRCDLELPEDIVEEVGRLYGLDKLPVELPKRSAMPVRRAPRAVLKQDLRTILAAAGAHEVLSYNFVHGEMIDKAGQQRDEAFRLRNALSPQLQYYRLSITPNLLGFIHPNIKAGHNEFALYEIGTAHSKRFQDAEGLPVESHLCSLVFASRSTTATPYYQARAYLDHVAQQLGVSLVYRPVGAGEQPAGHRPYEPLRSAEVRIKGSEKPLGIIGEYRRDVRSAFKLPDSAAGFEVDVDQLTEARQSRRHYKPVSRYPGTSQDVCFRVKADTLYADLEGAVRAALADVSLDTSAELIDIYQAEGDEHKQVTFRIGLVHYDETLTSNDANKIIEETTDKVTRSIRASIV